MNELEKAKESYLWFDSVLSTYLKQDGVTRESKMTIPYNELEYLVNRLGDYIESQSLVERAKARLNEVNTINMALGEQNKQYERTVNHSIRLLEQSSAITREILPALNVLKEMESINQDDQD